MQKKPLEKLNFLSLDFSYGMASAAIFSQGSLLASVKSKTQAGDLIDLIDKVANKAGLDKKNWHNILCTIGPGSFTSIRILLSTASALALGLNIKLLVLNSHLATAACAYSDSTEKIKDTKLIVFMKAYMGEIYFACYEFKNKIIELISPCVAKEADFFSKLDINATYCGNFNDYINFPANFKKLDIMEFNIAKGQAEALLKKYMTADEVDLPQALYLKASNAEINYKK